MELNGLLLLLLAYMVALYVLFPLAWFDIKPCFFDHLAYHERRLLTISCFVALATLVVRQYVGRYLYAGRPRNPWPPTTQGSQRAASRHRAGRPGDSSTSPVVLPPWYLWFMALPMALTLDDHWEITWVLSRITIVAWFTATFAVPHHHVTDESYERWIIVDVSKSLLFGSGKWIWTTFLAHRVTWWLQWMRDLPAVVRAAYVGSRPRSWITWTANTKQAPRAGPFVQPKRLDFKAERRARLEERLRKGMPASPYRFSPDVTANSPPAPERKTYHSNPARHGRECFRQTTDGWPIVPQWWWDMPFEVRHPGYRPPPPPKPMQLMQSQLNGHVLQRMGLVAAAPSNPQPGEVQWREVPGVISGVYPAPPPAPPMPQMEVQPQLPAQQPPLFSVQSGLADMAPQPPPPAVQEVDNGAMAPPPAPPQQQGAPQTQGMGEPYESGQAPTWNIPSGTPSGPPGALQKPSAGPGSSWTMPSGVPKGPPGALQKPGSDPEGKPAESSGSSWTIPSLPKGPPGALQKPGSDPEGNGSRSKRSGPATDPDDDFVMRGGRSGNLPSPGTKIQGSKKRRGPD